MRNNKENGKREREGKYTRSPPTQDYVQSSTTTNLTRMEITKRLSNSCYKSFPNSPNAKGLLPNTTLQYTLGLVIMRNNENQEKYSVYFLL